MDLGRAPHGLRVFSGYPPGESGCLGDMLRAAGDKDRRLGRRRRFRMECEEVGSVCESWFGVLR